jgi:hypothetical protein
MRAQLGRYGTDIAQSARVLAPRLNPPHAQKTLQSSVKSPAKRRAPGKDPLRLPPRLLPFEPSLIYIAISIT